MLPTVKKVFGHPVLHLGLALALLRVLCWRFSQANAPAVKAAFWQQFEGRNALWCWAALLRCGIYATQYVCLIVFFGVEIGV